MSASTKGTFVLLLAAALAPAADPTLLNMVMPEAKVVAGFDVNRVKVSPLGQFLLSQAQAPDADFQKFVTMTGFDPRHDLYEILLASDAGPKPSKGMVLARGNFDTSKITALAQLQGAKLEHYKGALIFTGNPRDSKSSAGEQPWFAFLDNSIAVMGDSGAVRGAIDRHTAGGSAPSPKLLARVNDLSGRYDFWLVSMTPVSEWAGKVPDENVRGAMKGDLLRGILETSGGVKFGADIEISGEAVTRSEKDATALADVFRFLVGLAQMNVKDPKAREGLKYLQAMNLQTSGNVVSLSLKIPQAEVEKAILAAKAQQARARKSAAARSKQAETPATPPRQPGDVIIHSSPSEMGTVVIKQR